MANSDDAPLVLWQGFHHSWTYNHRLNRHGDWIEHLERDGDRVTARVHHSAASGSGEDEATWQSFHAALRARGVWTHPVRKTLRLDGREGQLQTVVHEMRVHVPPALRGREVYTVLLNGFDLISEGDADKLASFHLMATPPVWDADAGDVVFALMAAINVDCDSPECDGYPNLGAYLATVATGVTLGLDPVASSLLALLPTLVKRLDLATSYKLEVQALIVAGDADTLHVTPATRSRSFAWDKDTAITRPQVGVLRTTIAGDSGDQWKDCVLGLQQISLEVTRKRGVFDSDTAMHYLQWDTCVLPVVRTGTEYTADLHLFFRNWMEAPSPFLNELEEATVTFRDSGSADVTAGVALLQFAEPVALVHGTRQGRIYWEAKNAPADSPLAVDSRDLAFEFPLAEPPLDWLPAVLHPLM